METSRITTLFLGLLCVFALGVVLLELKVVLLPFVSAVLFSIIMEPLALYLKSKRLPAILAMVVVLAIFGLTGFLFATILTSTAESFLEELPTYQEKFNVLVAGLLSRFDRITEILGLNPAEFELPISFQTLTSAARASATTFISFVSSTFLILLFMLFILMGVGDSAEKIKKAFPPEMAGRISKTIRIISTQVRQYLVTKALISLGTGMLTYIVLSIIGLDFPLIWGFTAFLLNFIPNVGSIISTLLPWLLALLQFNDPVQPIIVLVLLASIQVTMGNVIEPRLMAFRMNLSPLLVLLSLIFWGWLWGIWGMVLAVPLTATIKIVMENIEQLKPVSILMSGRFDIS